jgi:hypothetical protein
VIQELHADANRSQTHITHTPARRLLRSLLAMSEERAREFLAAAMRTLQRVAVDDWTEDVSQAFFWWSNVQQMRLFVQQVVSGEAQVSGDWEWLADEMDPMLLARSCCCLSGRRLCQCSLLQIIWN